MLFITVHTGRLNAILGSVKPDLQQGDKITRASPYAKTTHQTGAAASDAVKTDCDLSLDNASDTQRTKVEISPSEWSSGEELSIIRPLTHSPRLTRLLLSFNLKGILQESHRQQRTRTTRHSRI